MQFCGEGFAVVNVGDDGKIPDVVLWDHNRNSLCEMVDIMLKRGCVGIGPYRGGTVSSRTPHPPDAGLTCGRVRKNEEADSVQTDSLHFASRASRKAPHPLLRFSSQNRNDVSVLKGRAAERTRPRVYTGAASEAARCAPFPRQARKLRMVQTTLSCRCAAIHLVCSRLLPDPPDSLRWIPSEMRGRERVHSDTASGSRAAVRNAPPHPPDAGLTRVRERKNEEADTELPPLAGESAVQRVHSDVSASSVSSARSAALRSSPMSARSVSSCSAPRPVASVRPSI